MNDELLKLVEASKDWSFERITSSRVLCKGPCLVHFVLADPSNAANASSLTVYDGESTNGDLKFVLESKFANPCCTFPLPAYFRRGLYIDLTTNVESCTVQYLPLRS